MGGGAKKNAPARQRGGVYEVHALGNVQRNSRDGRSAAQLFQADSRSRVIAAARATELREAPMFSVSVRQAAELRRIAATTYAHRDRLLKALRAVELTAGDAVTYLDTQQPHARLTGLRREGLSVHSRWVLVPTANGRTRRVKAYRIAAEGTA